MKKLVTSHPLKRSFKWIAIPSIVASVAILLSLPSQSAANLDDKPMTIHLPLPSPNALLPVKRSERTSENATPEHEPQIVEIKKNDSLSTALDRVGVTKQTIHKIATSQDSKLITFIKPGDTLKVWLDEQGDLQKIHYPKNLTTTVEVVKTDLGFHIHKKIKEVEIRTKVTSGEIKGAFYPAAERAGLSPKSIMELADMLAWDVDFSRELQDGDTFKVIYEARYLDGEYIGDGDILAAQVTSDSGKQIHNGFVLRNDNHEIIGYYDETGKNLKKAFLKAPVDTVRITSKFNPQRMHPIYGYKRPHRGVDYGAPVGTPVRATGNGQITFRGGDKKRGYGYYVKVRHTNGYETLYGHLSRFGKFKQGQVVQQGQIIGYVGNTGASTGPHLHYEFRINGTHVDPLKMKFPAAGPISAKYKDDFLARSGFLLTQLDRISPSEHLAHNFE